METQKIPELTTAELCWVQQVEEALGGGQEAPKKDETPEEWHVLAQHLWKDPHHPGHQFHMGTDSLVQLSILHVHCSGVLGRFLLDTQPPDIIPPCQEVSPDLQPPFPTSGYQGAAEAQCHTAPEPSMCPCLPGLPTAELGA